jgi:hypothetical protein
VTYRTGNHWGVTIVREGDQPADAQLVAVVVNGDQALAERICTLLNADDDDSEAGPCIGLCAGCSPDCRLVGDSCSCTVVGPDPGCVVHRGRRARGPKPPPVGPGCVCDGSGRRCPRHGEVI